jgi:hypothetical protein
MGMQYQQLGSEIQQAMGFPAPPSRQLIGFAQGIIEELQQNGKFTSRKKPSGHIISGITPSSMASKIASACGYNGVSSMLVNFSSGVCEHIISKAITTYSAPTPAEELPPPQCWYKNGIISGLIGSEMASKIANAMGQSFVSDKLLAECNAIVKHIMSNAIVTDGNIL